ncbi:MAG TPA: carbohydrate ABC transporter permease [Thermotogota bacterium]|nr:carbohydrate ABC transporter permease [Thermotogota bacterium]HRW92824.1 carbohydrate ABC transporter permease [Thermotogota bacterium]
MSARRAVWIRRGTIYALLVLLAVFFSFPFFWVLSTSFKTAVDVYTWPPKWIPNPPTLENYRIVLQKLPIFRYFFNTLLITGMGILMNVVLAALAAYPLARLRFKGRNLIFTFILLPMMIPMQGSLIVNFITIIKMNLYNSYLAVVLPSAVSIFGIFLMRQHYLSIPKELEDAARIDGCNEFQLWWRIMLPMVRPATTSLAIFSFTAYWNSFLWPLIVLNDSEKFPLQVGLSNLSSMFEGNFRQICAGIIISTIPILVFFFFTQRFFIEGYQGALKQ